MKLLRGFIRWCWGWLADERPRYIKKPATVVCANVEPDSPKPKLDHPASVLQLLNRHNAERDVNNQKPLLYNYELAKAAQRHAEYMARHELVEHDWPVCYENGEDISYNFEVRVLHCGYCFSVAGENLARGTAEPDGVMDAWLFSDGHRRNILSWEYKHVGFGCAMDEANAICYWCAVYAAPNHVELIQLERVVDLPEAAFAFGF